MMATESVVNDLYDLKSIKNEVLPLLKWIYLIKYDLLKSATKYAATASVRIHQLDYTGWLWETKSFFELLILTKASTRNRWVWDLGLRWCQLGSGAGRLLLIRLSQWQVHVQPSHATPCSVGLNLASNGRPERAVWPHAPPPPDTWPSRSTLGYDSRVFVYLCVIARVLTFIRVCVWFCMSVHFDGGQALATCSAHIFRAACVKWWH